MPLIAAISYNGAMPARWIQPVRGMMVGMFLGVICGCIAQLPAVPEAENTSPTVAVGRVVAIINGERSRRFPPAVRSFEILNRQTRERLIIEIKSDDERFVLPVIPGEYELSRVQISEGPFMSMAQLDATFIVHNGPITCVGTWRFSIDSPKYGRMVTVSMVEDEEDRNRAVQFLNHTFASFDEGAVSTDLPDPSGLQSRLFEVAPYPRYSRYFRRHWW